MHRLRFVALAALLGVATAAGAAGEGAAPPPPPLPDSYTPPPPAPETAPHEAVPEVRIVTKPDAIHEEYRVNGQLYMIKVTPSKGKPYYLFDPDGSGQFRRSDHAPGVAIPMWVIKSW